MLAMIAGAALAASSGVASNEATDRGLTASLGVAAETRTPGTSAALEISLALLTSPEADQLPADALREPPPASLSEPEDSEPIVERHRGAGWIVAGIAGGIPLGAFGGAVLIYQGTQLSPPQNATGYYVAGTSLAILGGAFFGLLGYYLGREAEEGNLTAQIFVVVIDVIDVLGAAAIIIASNSFRVQPAG